MTSENSIGKQVARALLMFLACGAFCAPASLAGAEWNFPSGTNCNLRVPHDAALNFPDGFKATVRFACDLDKIGKKSRFANLVTKGRDFNDGWSIMVKNDGQLLVNLNGVRPAYGLVGTRIESNREHLLEVYVCTNCVRVILDGQETGSYWYAGRRDMGKARTPLQIGNMGGYKFAGRLFSVRLDPLSSVTLPPGGLKPISYQPPKQQTRAEIKWVKPICVEKDRYIGWPTVCRLANGDILAVFSGDRDGHICPWGKVQMVRSTDDGETWSAPVTIANGILDDRDAGIVQLPDGEIVVTWFTSVAYRMPGILAKHPEYRRHDEKLDPEAVKAAMGYFLSRSRDTGKTWSKPEKLKNCEQTPHGPIVLKDGSLLQIGRRTVIANATATGRYRRTIITVSRSTDAGRTWTVLCPEIPDRDGENSKPFMFHEPHVVELADGTLVGMVRYHGDDGRKGLAKDGNGYMRQTVSTDGGKTWTPMAKTGMLGLPPHLIRLADGKLVCVYGRRLATPGFGEFAAISDDGGKTWDVANEISLAPSYCGDLGYPASCVLANGDILTVFYQSPGLGENQCLMATKWRVK